MKKIMHIAASPRVQRSHSRKLAEFFLEKFLSQHPDYELDLREIGTGTLPAFTEPGATAKFKSIRREPMTPEEIRQWSGAEDEFRRFAAADKYVFSVPMWNFSMPYHLKQYFDLITQPGWTFTMNEKGYVPLCGGKSALFCCASGGVYPQGELWRDHLRPYLKYWSEFVGLRYFEILSAGHNLDVDHLKLETEARAAAERILKEF